MVDVIGSVAKLTPPTATQAIKNSPLKLVYEHCHRYTAEFETVVTDSPVGEMELTLPSSYPIVDIINEQPNGYEPVLIDALSDHLDESTTYYDVGSAFGVIALAAQMCGVPGSKIHTFDPNRFMSYCLSKNAPRVHHTNMAVDDSKFTLDEYAIDYDSPDVVKIDVEGAESSVLAGMEDLLKQQPIIFCEMHPNFGTNVKEPISLLRQHNYELTVSDHREDSAVWESVQTASLPDTRTFMLRAIPIEKS